jgi:hypothetical protein
MPHTIHPENPTDHLIKAYCIWVNIGQMASVHTRGLQYGILVNDVEHVRMVLDRGADADADWSPLRSAIKCRLSHSTWSPGEPYSLEVIELLLERGAHADVEDLIKALMYGYVEIVRLLIAHGVDVFQQDEFGNTALQIIYPMCMHDIWLSGTDGCTPKQQAAAEKRRQIMQLIINEMDRVHAAHNNPRNLALAMGNHGRIGESSPLLDLDPGVVEMIGKYSAPAHRGKEYHSLQ